MTIEAAAPKQLASRIDALDGLFGLFGPDLRLRKIISCIYKRFIPPNRASTREASCLAALCEIPAAVAKPVTASQLNIGRKLWP